jgi:prepilin-type N-terminal cleavage/methylation domain-containing protein
MHSVDTRQDGFTLIELIAVIVLLGVLSAIALPKFVDLKKDANKAVTSSVMGSFYSAANQFHLQWIVKGQSASITVAGQSVPMSSTGYPDRSTADSTGCIEIWSNIMDSDIDIVVYPGASSVSEWSALRFGPACVYINHNGSTFSNTQTPFFSYFPSTGTGAGFNLD